MFKKCVIVILHLSFVICNLSFAYESLRFYSEEIVVTAVRLPYFLSPLDRFPANVTVITSREIADSMADNLPEILNKYEGVIVGDSLGFGLEANVGMRGFGGEGKNTLVLLDGIRVSEPYDNTLFWRLIPLKQIERVEVIRGGMASIYGGGALDGVINIITKTPAKKFSLRAEAEGGSFGERNYFVSSVGPIGEWQYQLGINREQLSGYRKNSGYDATAWDIKFERDLGSERKLSLATLAHQSANGIAGGITIEAYNNDPQQANLYAADTDGFTNKLHQYSLNYQWGPASLNVFNNSRTQDSVHTYQSGTSEASLITYSTGGTLQWSTKNQAGLLSLGIEYRNDQVDNPTDLSGWAGHKALTKNIWGYFAQDDVLLSERFSLTLGCRYDREEIGIFDRLDPSADKNRVVSAFSPKLGCVFSERNWSLFANAAKSFKSPEGNTLIFETPGLFSANPDIEPTIANNFETGWRHDWTDKDNAKFSVYRIEALREILYNSHTMKNENFDTLRQGVEASLKKQINTGLFLSFNYTFALAKFIGGDYNGKTIPLVPQNKYVIRLSAELPKDLRLSIDWLKICSQFALNDFNNIHPMDNYDVVDLRLARDRDNIMVYGDIKNVFNAKYSAYNTSNAAGTVNYNPAPARQYLVGVKIAM